MIQTSPHAHKPPHRDKPSIWLSLFCLALMGPACAINGALVALAIPAMAPYGYPGLVMFAAVGAVLGTFPARWMARKIHDGISDRQ
ncbi:MAG: hypothetical protein ABL908_14540 [Hyphomicrobium sp.]